MFNTRERERERERGALESEEDLRIRKECVWVFCNVIHGGDDLQIKFLVDNGCLPPLVRLLKCDISFPLLTVVIEGIENILKRGQRILNDQGRNPFVAAVEMCGGVDKISILCHEAEASWRGQASDLAFVKEEDEEDEEDEENWRQACPETFFDEEDEEKWRLACLETFEHEENGF